MECLDIYLKEFKEITLNLIDNLNKENYDDIDRLMNDRQRLIESINKLQYKKEEFENLVKELDIIKCNEDFGILMKTKKEEYKKEIKKYALKRNASRIYNKDIYGGCAIFSKKI
ncbi:hypothetical protein [Clostridium sp. Marseille-Q2269]|uniref:hypothetical protein n=1 Tax=Clostridium sp. Marseille-Q2269 TaxID=2942205 RepID=UPI002073259D|nr:hypothetical protein [Clostridium sp. Marseille-Q2269]